LGVTADAGVPEAVETSVDTDFHILFKNVLKAKIKNQIAKCN